MLRTSLTVGFGLLLPPLAGQRLDELRPTTPTPWTVGGSAAPVFGDLDGDGTLDLVTAFGLAARVYRGLPHAQFMDVTPGSALTPFVVTVKTLSLGDLDGDGDLDIYLSDGDRIRLLRNDGAFSFTNITAASLVNDRTWPRDLLPRDVDGDGDLDLLGPTDFLNIPNVLWLNDGTGRLTGVVATHMPPGIVPSAAARFADVEGDGDPDIFLASRVGLKLLRNDGSGHFVDVTATTLPINSGNLRTVAVADVDRDGDIDVLFSAWGGALSLYLNGGAGTFTDASGQLPFVAAVLRTRFVDLDADGAPELVVESDVAAGAKYGMFVLQNDGTGRFVDATPTKLSPPEALSSGVASADVDRDGAVDLFVTRNYSTNGLYLNDRRGRVSDVWVGKVPENTGYLYSDRAAAMADFDADGDLDLATSSAGLNYLRNDGRGQFVDATVSQPAGFGMTSASDIEVGDVDRDGDLDLVVAPTRLWLNDGTGRFTDASNQLLAVSTGYSIDLGDVDGDGDLDLISANDVRGQGVFLWLNDGTGRFLVAVTLPANLQRSTDARFVDIDGDRDLDIVVINRNGAAVGQLGTNLIYVNHGGGVFVDETAARLEVWFALHRSVQAGDLDGDGDVDLVFGVDRFDGGARAYLNDGTGTFTRASAGFLPFVADEHAVMHLFDSDEDGDLDLVASSVIFASGRAMFFYENQGTSFVNATAQIDARLPAVSFASGDIDGDGDVDLYVGSLDYTAPSFESRNRMLTNCRRQIEAPALAFPGGSLNLTHYARQSASVGDHTALGFLGAALLPVPFPLPFGRLFLDPGAMVSLPATAITVAGGGNATQTLPLPLNPGLSGVSIYLQAATFANSDPFGTLRLTNALCETIR